VEDTGGVFLTKAMKKKLKKTRKKQSKNDGAQGGVPNLPNANINSEAGKIPQACDQNGIALAKNLNQKGEVPLIGNPDFDGISSIIYSTELKDITRAESILDDINASNN
jgi:hypothetical protein